MNFDMTLAKMPPGFGEAPLIFQRTPVPNGTKIPMITELGMSHEIS
jgi:hypothetical protein